MNRNTAQRNARLVMATSFFGDLAFILPVWLLYCTNQLHLSTTISVALFTSVWLVSALFEIPTGSLADTWGRRKTFVIGNLLLVLFPIAFIIHVPLNLFWVIVALAGFGNALTSGTLAPLVHASYEKAGLGKKAYNQFLSNSGAVLFIARALSGATGALLYAIKPELPFAGWTVAILCNFLLGLWIVEDREITRHTETHRTHIMETLREMKRSDVIVVMLGAYIIFEIAAEAMWTAYPLLYEHDGRSVFTIGLLFSLIACVSAVSSFLVRRWYARFHPIIIMLVAAVLAVLTALLLWQPILALRLLAVVPTAAAFGTVVAISATIQHVVPNRYQSTALSIKSVMTYVLYTLASLLIGWVLDNWGINSGRRVLLISSLVAVGIMLWLSYTKRHSSFRLEEPDVVAG